MTTRKLLAAHIASVLGLSLAAPVFAADDAKANDDVERLEVIGSRIKRSDVEGANPVQAINRGDIDKAGYQNLGQILEKIPSAGSGTFSTRGNNQDSTANGAAGISLRGFKTNATLVLLNGRRTSVSSFAQDITTNFVDLNSIPVAAIERVEILKDGASALYGADAVVGVVNVVLRKDFEGLEVNAGYGNTTDSDNHENTASVIWGFNDDKSGATLVLDYFGNSALMNKDRGDLGSANQSANGGEDFRSSRSFPGRFVVNGNTVIDPSCPAERRAGQTCLFDYGPFNLLNPRAERIGGLFTGHRQLTDAVELFTEIQVQHNTSEAQGAPTPLDNSAGLVVPASHPNNPFGATATISRYRVIDAGPRRWDIETDNTRILAGLRGAAGDWDWEATAQKARSESTQSGTQGWVRGDKLRTAITEGRFNPFLSAHNSQAVIDEISTNVVRQGESHMTSWDLRVSNGTLAELPTGALGVAMGVEWRDEDAQDVPDRQFSEGLIFGTEAVSAEADRSQKAAYVEFAVPLWEHAELQLAGRYDDYDGFGSTFNPKVGMRWQPVDMLTLRGSWGKGFRAPSLAEIGLGPSEESQFFIDSYRCQQSGRDCGALDYNIVFSGNPNLAPEKSESWNVGAVIEPMDDLAFTVDFWNTELTDTIEEAEFGLFYAAECNNQASSICERGTPETAGTLGPLLRLHSSFENLSSAEADGVDLSGQYRMDLGDAGNLRLNLDYTYLRSFDRAGTELAGEYEYPKHRWTGSADWVTGDWGFNAAVYYIGEFGDKPDNDFDGVRDYTSSETVDSMTTVSLQARFTGIEKTVLTVGVDNAFDEEPPFAIGDGDADLYGYAANVHSPRGRFVYGKVSYRF